MLHVGYPQEVVDTAKRMWSDEQRALISDAGFMISAATIFPNLSFVHNWPVVNAEGLVAPFISIRLWQPVSATRTEICSWFAVDASAPQWFKDASYKAYLMCFGSSGMFEQDDVENWVSLTNTAAGAMARRLLLNGRMGLLEDGTEVVPALTPEQFHGPGVAHTGYGEYNQRELLDRWADHLEQPVKAAAAVEVGGADQVSAGQASAAVAPARQPVEQAGAQS